MMSNNNLLLMIVFGVLFVHCFRCTKAYKNYTVGDSLGWYDALMKPSVNYQKWVSGKTFSLGDFLIFNTDTNHSVIQTYNSTTYNRCISEDDDNSTQWSYSSDPSATAPAPTTVAVPLLKTGPTFFLSDDYDGEQCKNGQRFKINVTYGHGLPPSLKSPEESPAPTSPQAGDDSSAPDTLVPAYFDHPRNVSDDGDSEPSGSVSLVTFCRLYGIFVVLISLFCIV